jgi:hypothetical protein
MSKRHSLGWLVGAYEALDEHYSRQENRREQKYSLCGMILTSSFEISSAFTGRREWNLCLPDHPRRFQKIIAFLLVKARFVAFARRENEWIEYAFSKSAWKIFAW